MSTDDKARYADEKTTVDQVETGSVKEELPAPATTYEGTPEEKALLRRLDMRIMPLACILYLFACKTNLGNARLQGLPQDTLGGDPTGIKFDWVNSTFFFSYILCQVPATIVSKLFPPRIWIGCAAIGWGVSSTLLATGFNFPGMLVGRVFLGIFEAGFGPGIPLYMSFWYTKREMGTRMAYWFGFAAVAGAFGGLIAFGIQHAHVSISNWRLLFIVEGVPTVMMGILSIWLLPDRPEETPFLNEDERKIQLERRERGLKADFGRTVNKKHITAAFNDWRIYCAGVIYFGANCALASNSAFLPTIIKTFGVSNAKAQLLTVPPYAVSAVVLTITSYYSDRIQSRGIPMSFAAVGGAIGYLLLLTVPSNNHVRYFATFCITSGTYTVIGIMIAWFAHNLGSETKKATGIPMYMAIGQCGSVLGSHLFPATDGPRYIKGFAVSCALLFFAAICGIILTISYRIENKRRDDKYGQPDPDAAVDTTELADKAPMFRYVI
ncbi:MFS general substrate transporter [Abortiporus biennis]|nr:MFS general substrate transporter [Abortiporus biennis]